MRKVIGIGETILDIIFRENRPYAAVPGGSVFNGLTSLGRLGVSVLFVSELGDDQVGNLIRAFMVENHISTDYVDRYLDGKSPISLAFLDEHNNANYSFYKNYPAQRLDVSFPPIEADDIFIYGSYYSLNPALRERMVEFLQYARERGARETDADREKTVEDDVSEEGKSERLDDVRSGELSQFLSEKEKTGERNDPESDESAQCDEHGVVLRKEKRGDVNEPPERSGGDAEQDT